MWRLTVLTTQKPQEISYVLTGGLMAALMGPEIARKTVNNFPNAAYEVVFSLFA